MIMLLTRQQDLEITTSDTQYECGRHLRDAAACVFCRVVPGHSVMKVQAAQHTCFVSRHKTNHMQPKQCSPCPPQKSASVAERAQGLGQLCNSCSAAMQHERARHKNGNANGICCSTCESLLPTASQRLQQLLIQTCHPVSPLNMMPPISIPTLHHLM